MMRTGGTTRRAAAGITLLELVCAVVLVGILGKFAMAKLGSPLTLTLPTQAQSLADVIRRAQSLAVVRGQRMSVSVAASGLRKCKSGTPYPISVPKMAPVATSVA